MMKRLKNKQNMRLIGGKMKIVTSLLIVLFHQASAINIEDFRATADLSNVTSNGFYRIAITPDVISFINSNYSDIRILNEEGNEVPYIISSEVKSSVKELFHPYPILINKALDSKITRVIIHNKEIKTISQIQLLIKNADVHKEATLLGSNDLEDWYVIKDRFILHSLYHDEFTMTMEAMNFPPSDYEYLKFEINDSSSAPVHVVDAGFYNYVSEKGKYQTIPVQNIHQIDSSDGQSYIRITFAGRQLLDVIDLEFSGAEYFYRNARLARLVSRKVKKRDRVFFFEYFGNLKISSNQRNRFSFNALEVDTFY